MSKQRTVPCPLCQFGIANDLVRSSKVLDCPQCGRALRVTPKLLVETGALIGSLVFMAWLWARFRGVSFRGWDFPMIAVVTLLLLAPVAPLLPRELMPRTRTLSEKETTQDISTHDRIR